MNKRARHEEGLRPRSSEGRDPAFMTSNHVCWGHYGGLVAFRHLPTYLPTGDFDMTDHKYQFYGVIKEDKQIY